jgi:hypothetical protein
VTVILTILHALNAVESFGVVVISAIDVRTHIQNLVLAAAGALNYFGFLKPSGLLRHILLIPSGLLRLVRLIPRIYRFQLLIDPKEVEIGQE